jgi:SET domain-containing protein
MVAKRKHKTRRKRDHDYKIGKSGVHGEGVIALREFKKGETVLKALEEGPPLYITPAGSKINHCPGSSPMMNTHLVKRGNDWWLVTTRDVGAGEEFTINYNELPPFLARAEPHYSKCRAEPRPKTRSAKIP